MPEKPKKQNNKNSYVSTFNLDFKHKTKAQIVIDFDVFHEKDYHDAEFISEVFKLLLKDHRVTDMARAVRQGKNVLKLTPTKVDIKYAKE